MKFDKITLYFYIFTFLIFLFAVFLRKYVLVFRFRVFVSVPHKISHLNINSIPIRLLFSSGQPSQKIFLKLYGSKF